MSSGGGHCCPGCEQAERLGRRRMLGLLGGGAVLALAGAASLVPDAGAQPRHRDGHPVADPLEGFPQAAPAAVGADPAGGPPIALGAIPDPHPGAAKVISSGPSGTQKVALTIDDGYCAQCITGYVQFAKSSGIHITLSPNGVYSQYWTPSIVSSVREMVANRQVQIGNHTWDHANLLTLSAGKIEDEITRNEDWIADTFGITARPYFRPPFGYYNDQVTEIAGNLGYTSVLMWNGTFGDATVETPTQIVSLAEQWLQPSAIVLGHMNHPAVLSVFTKIEAIIAQHGLEPVTLDEMFGSSRSIG